MNWTTIFHEIKQKPYAESLHTFLNEEYRKYTCYPPRPLLFNAFNLTPYDQVRVVIIGQDPYHQPGQAMGLAFSVPENITLPPSLQNIFKEIEDNFGQEMIPNGDLTYLAKQGVLLLNARLSVRASQPLSHNIKEYQAFLSDILSFIDLNNSPIVFMLWGGFARGLKPFIKNPNRLILESVHPSPLSANRGGWFGKRQFIRCNEYLENKGYPAIKWHNT
ncbi:MAG: uracil-DNA glycosylase [Bacilli bacterium]|jgi:uracil-DNA glycosylase